MTRPDAKLLTAALALVAAGAQAQPAAPAKPAPAAPAGAPVVPGLSPQGNAVVAKVQQQGDPIGQAAIAKLRVLIPQISQVASAPTIDVEKFATLLKQQDALAAQIQGRRTDLLISILRQLPAADRGPFLRAVAARLPAQAPGGR